MKHIIQSLFRRLADAWAVFTTPKCWLQLYDYSPEWDAELNRLMRSHKFTKIGAYSASIGGREVWIANYPYASFTLNQHEIRPARATILRARGKLMAELLKSKLR